SPRIRPAQMSGNRPFLCTPDRVAYFRAGPKKPRQKASRRQSQIDPRSFVAAGFLILATSLAKEEFPASEVLAVYVIGAKLLAGFRHFCIQRQNMLHLRALGFAPLTGLSPALADRAGVQAPEVASAH